MKNCLLQRNLLPKRYRFYNIATMKKHFLYLSILIGLFFNSCSITEQEAEMIANGYNYIIGTQTIGAKYKFTDKPVLVETSDRILEMGSNILKIALNPVEADVEQAEFKHASPLQLITESEVIKEVLAKDFRYIFMWVTTPGVKWADGMDEDEIQLEYKSMYEFSRYLLDHYEGTGKSFYLGHWEGDWLLLGSYSRTQKTVDPVRIQGMIDWYNIRQRAIEDARKDNMSDVSVYHYAELNRVNPALYYGYDRIVNRILPNIDVDYVSYSSYESTSEEVNGADYNELKGYLFKSLDYIESNLKHRNDIVGKRVFIGEFGFDLPLVGKDSEEQARRAFNVIRASIEWGCPFCLYWEMYDNEGEDKGFWMIDNNNIKQPVYNRYHQFYKDMYDYVYNYALENGTSPTVEEYGAAALDYLNKTPCVDSTLPSFKSFNIQRGKIELEFNNLHEGLKTKDNLSPKGFFVAGSDRVFYNVYAEIQGAKVILHCPDIVDPSSVRYLIPDLGNGNLEDFESTPIPPFKTDNWDESSVVYSKSQLNIGLEQEQDVNTLPSLRGQDVSYKRESLQKLPICKAHSSSIPGWKLYPEKLLNDEDIHSLDYDVSRWYEATVPGTVLATLVDQGVYPDPYYGLNNMLIPDNLYKTAWWYRTIFSLPENNGKSQLKLLLNGINYKAEVWLNGNELGDLKGAFIRGEYLLTDYLNPDGDNVLAIKICPPEHPGIPHEQSMVAGMGPNGGQLCLDGPTFISSEGWDWVPAIRDRNIGIWQDVELIYTDEVSIGDYQIITDLPLPDTTSANIIFKTELINNSSAVKKCELSLEFGEVCVSKKFRLRPNSKKEIILSPDSHDELVVINPKLWWPNGMGNAELYDATVAVSVDGKESDCKKFRFGIRELSYELAAVNLDGEEIKINYNPTAARASDNLYFDFIHHVPSQENNAVGVPKLLVSDSSPGITKTEYSCSPYIVFHVNGRKVFVRGGNWGMDDAMKRVSEEHLDIAIRLHKEQGFNMIRNWTGESTSEHFYSLCDKYGILVYNDFSMSTQEYNIIPDDYDLMLSNIEDIIKRYRNHPSIAAWCPRNEGLAPVSMEKDIMRLIAKYDGTRHYIGTSRNINQYKSGPWGIREHSDNFTDALVNGFSTEFGTISIPTSETLRKFIPESELWPISDTWAYHDLHHGGWLSFEKIVSVLNNKYGKSDNSDDFCRKAQIFNYDAYRSMFEGFNSKMWDNTSGVLLWMSHPAWPSVLWQTYTFDYETPAAYFGSKKACEPVHVQYNPITRKVQVVNTTMNPTDINLECSMYDINGMLLKELSWDGLVEPSSVVNAVEVDGETSTSGPVLLRLMYSNNYKNDYWLCSDALSNKMLLGLESPSLKLVKQEKSGENLYKFTIKNMGRNPAIYIKLNVRDKDGRAILPAFFSDGYFNLLPGESQDIELDLSSAPSHETPYLTYDFHAGEKVYLGFL